MCGICGFFQSENIADINDLKSMNNQIIHRGPDDDGYYYNGRVGLAARRLSIIDLSTGHQPLTSYSKNSWITYNGEVYNFKELKQDLKKKGYVFRTNTDTEVIVNLYEEYGVEFVKKLIGMFAIGIFDIKKNLLILARDHIGIKPLYYYYKDNSLVFGSEIKSILKFPNIDKTLNYEAIDYFLSLEYIPAPLSIFKNINKLLPGHYLLYNGEEINIKKYWDIEPKERSINDFSELKEEFWDILNNSVKIRMISDVPLGAFLSGGVDSSTIVGVMTKNSSEKIKTFSIGFEEKSYSELKYSEIVSKHFDTEHYVKELNPDINDLILKISKKLDEPLGDFSNYPTFLVSKTAREKVTVVLSGDGGDEIFGGYEHYIAQKLSKIIDIKPFKMLHNPLYFISRLIPPSTKKKGLINRIKRFSEGLKHDSLNRHFRWMMFLTDNQKKSLYNIDFYNNIKNHLNLYDRYPFSIYFNNLEKFRGINKDLYLDFKTYMVDDILVKVDRMSMLNSLEARVPLLDYRIVEFAFSLPPEYKLKNNVTKWFFKESLKGFLPNDIIYRRKEGFSIPIKNWLKNELKDLMFETLSKKNINELGFINYEYVNKLIKMHLLNKENNSHRIWSLISLILWYKNFY